MGMSKIRSAKTAREYCDNAVKKDSTEGHTTIKSLLHEEIEKIPDYGINKYGKKLTKNVSAYVKKRHRYIFNTNFLEKGEEKSARVTIREYLFRYVLEKDNESGSEDKADITNEMTPIERDEELGALMEIEDKLDYTSLNNLIKTKVNNPGIVDPISADFDEIIEKLSKLGQKLSIENQLHSYITELQRLKFLFKNIVPVVGGLRINIVKDFDLFIKIDDASRLLMGEYKKKVPLSATCPGNVDGKYYIIATVNLPRGTPVCNLPVEYNSFPVIVDYGIMKASTSERCHEYHENIKPGISISDSECNGAFTLGTIFTTESQPGKKYLLTIQLLTISKYNDLSIDEDGQLLDFAFCEIDNKRGLLATNKPCRTTGHTNGYMRNIMQEILIDEPFEKVTFAKVLVVYGYFGDRGDSGSPVYDEYGLWGIYQSTSESKYFSGVVPIELILQKVYEKECTNFDLLVDEMEEENNKSISLNNYIKGTRRLKRISKWSEAVETKNSMILATFISPNKNEPENLILLDALCEINIENMVKKLSSFSLGIFTIKKYLKVYENSLNQDTSNEKNKSTISVRESPSDKINCFLTRNLFRCIEFMPLDTLGESEEYIQIPRQMLMHVKVFRPKNLVVAPEINSRVKIF
ncbi:hypothetical protein GLOIN_2v1477844 [Rhizophagus irregularis DAOM 181602=DAOM 197198]|nr:hypothetical protein GLOIN_2v1477844 [Rhizophagus irregularis DAOM 181602=DAOM 197198]